MNHDVIVIGGSVGSVEVLVSALASLPADLPASLFLAIHTHASSSDYLAETFGRGPLPASLPTHQERIVRGRIYVAPPDNQLLVRRGRMEVVRGPRENGHRPAADALFRTAASAFESRVVGVVLSGYQDCGTAGMMSVKARGGVSVVQDPATAAAPEMPRSVLRRMAVDHVIEPERLASLLTDLAHAAAGGHSGRKLSRSVRQVEGLEPGARAELVCPSCQGVLTETEEGSFHHFRCHVGHAFSLESLVREQGEEMERALWAALRSLEESAALSGRLARMGKGELRRRFAEKARTQCGQADLIRMILLGGDATFGAEEAEEAFNEEAAAAPAPTE